MSEPEATARDRPWRPPTDGERALLEAIVDQPFAGSLALLSQVEMAEAQQGCDCGCGTINLRVDRATAPPVVFKSSLAPGEAEVLSDEGTSMGGLILFVRDGYICCLEVYSWGEPAALPPIHRIRPYVVEGRVRE